MRPNANDLFARLDEEVARLGRKPNRAEAIAAVQKYLDSFKPLKKETPVSKMTDEEFMEHLESTYTWLDVPRELTKCFSWCQCKPGKKPTRPRIINWLNKADGKPFTPNAEVDVNIYAVPPEGWQEALVEIAGPSYFQKTWEEIRTTFGRRILLHIRNHSRIQ